MSSISSSMLTIFILLLLPLSTSSLLLPNQCNWGLPRNPLTYLPLCLDFSANASHPASWTPWTHPPHCVEAADSPWCVYTNAAVPSGERGDNRGLSVVTTPDLAASVFDLSHHHPLQKAFTFPPVAAKAYDQRPYEITDVKGKGLGCVAKEKIKKGRVLLIDHAVFLATVEYPGDVMQEEVRELMRVGVDRLGDPMR